MLEIIRKRRSVRRFLDKGVEQEKLHEILKAAMVAPTAKNKRPWEFIIVADQETRRQLSLATPYAAFAKDAPLVIVICYDTREGNRFKEDCSLSAGHIYLEALNQGLGTCFVQIAEGTEAGVGEPEAYVKRLLAIPAPFRVQCLMPLGYPAQQAEPHRDGEFDKSKLHYERF